MIKRLSVRELKRYCEKHPSQKIIFDTQNQDWYKVSSPCKMRMTFAIMLIYENPNLVYLVSEDSRIHFDRIKSAEINTDASILGDILTLYCGDLKSDKSDITYTLILS